MRRTTSHKAPAIIYVLGLVRRLAKIGGSVLLTHPTRALSEAFGEEGAAVQLAVTMSLVIVLASLVTVGVGLGLRTKSEPKPATQRR